MNCQKEIKNINSCGDTIETETKHNLNIETVQAESCVAAYY